MADDRKKIIVKEIQYWKKSRLLPREYCDFLLALYTQGEGDNGSSPASIREKSNFSFIILVTTLILLPLSFLVIYFTEMEPILQTGLLSTFVGVSFVQAWWLKKKDYTQYHFSFISGLLIGLLLSVNIVRELFTNNSSIYTVVIINCLLWAWIGWRTKMSYLTVSGITGIILLILFIVL